MTQKLDASELDDRLLPDGEVVADRFEVGEQIGEGPFGHVYRAQDTLVETEVAIKVFSDEVVDTPIDEEQFLKATRQARALTQQNVVRLHDSGIHEDHPWVSMQRLEGLNLQKVARLRWQREESFGLQELDPILSQITLALQHISRDFPHGNLKPENIIFLPELLKVTDSYVLAALPDDVFAERNADSPFVAPEILEQHGEPDPRCDVYSVGALIGYLLFGPDYEPGTQGDAPGGLSAVDTLCKRATADDPDERYGSVEALNEDFTSIVDTGALLERRPTASSAAEVPSSPPPSPGEDSEPATAKAAADSPPEPPEEGGESVGAGESDPLEQETPSDIGMPLEEDIATTEFDRDENAELGDYLPTNEVDRDKLEQMETNEVDRDQVPSGEDFPPPPESPDDEEPEEISETDDTAPEEEDVETAGEVSDPDEPSDDAVTTSADEEPEDVSGGPEEAGEPEESKDMPVAVIGAVAVLVAVFVGVVFFAGPGDESGDDSEADAEPTEVAETDEDSAPSDESDTAEKEETEDQEDEIPEGLREAVAAAVTPPLEARDEAASRAEERAEELEAEREEEEEEQEQQQQQQQEQQQQQAATGAGASPGGAGQPGDCPSGMVRVRAGGEYVCVDAYEYPGRGHQPRVNVSWFDAKRLCEQEDKRLCGLQEWRGACGNGYPYGSSFDPERCNTADADGFERSLAEAGSFPECRSPSGAYDMSGNVHEWVQEQRVVGGAFDSRSDAATCGYTSAMSPGSARRNVGFRCCTSPS